MQLLHESLLDAFTTDTGEVDFGRKGGMSLAKQVNIIIIRVKQVVKFTLAIIYSWLFCVNNLIIWLFGY